MLYLANGIVIVKGCTMVHCLRRRTLSSIGLKAKSLTFYWRKTFKWLIELHSFHQIQQMNSWTHSCWMNHWLLAQELFLSCDFTSKSVITPCMTRISQKSTLHLHMAKSMARKNYVEGTRSLCVLRGNIKDKHYTWFDGFSYLSCRETDFNSWVDVKLQPDYYSMKCRSRAPAQFV